MLIRGHSGTLRTRIVTVDLGWCEDCKESLPLVLKSWLSSGNYQEIEQCTEPQLRVTFPSCRHTSGPIKASNCIQ